MYIGERARLSRLQVVDLNLLISIRTYDLKTDVLSAGPPHGPAAALSESPETRAIGMDDENTAGKTTAGTEADPLPVRRPARDRTRSFHHAPGFTRAVRRRNVETRGFVLSAREHDRAAVRGHIAIRVAAGTRRSRRPRRSTIRWNTPDTQRFGSPSIEEDRSAIGREARIDFRSFAGCDLACLAAFRRNDPQMPRAVRLIARIDNFLAVRRKSRS